MRQYWGNISNNIQSGENNNNKNHLNSNNTTTKNKGGGWYGGGVNTINNPGGAKIMTYK